MVFCPLEECGKPRICRLPGGHEKSVELAQWKEALVKSFRAVSGWKTSEDVNEKNWLTKGPSGGRVHFLGELDEVHCFVNLKVKKAEKADT